ncbi:hypothetical protein [Paraburkholderia sp. DGU8]|uniref:hypothetical protein n=1 Tax=Paraburkholderia sp. DGU8 TaxID=3161997 RepID=UPI003465F79F
MRGFFRDFLETGQDEAYPELLDIMAVMSSSGKVDHKNAGKNDPGNARIARGPAHAPRRPSTFEERNAMQPNEYYSLIVSSEGGHWNQAEGSTPKGRFHFCSVEPVIGRFSPLNDTVELSLKQFPAIFACETRSDPPTPAYVGRITKVEHRTDTYYLHFERDYSVDPISQEKLLAMAEALDIHKPHRGLGDLDSTHWSVKQVDLYHVLVRNGLVRPPAQPTAALSEVATGIGHPLAVQQERGSSDCRRAPCRPRRVLPRCSSRPPRRVRRDPRPPGPALRRLPPIGLACSSFTATTARRNSKCGRCWGDLDRKA